MKRVFILVNGILARPGDSEGWTDRGVTWIQTRTTAKAEKFEYACGPILRRFRQGARAAAIAKMAGFYQRAGYTVSLIGHSNGCDLISRVLALRCIGDAYTQPIESVHLIAAATDERGIHAGLDHADVRRVFVYWSSADRALRLAAWTRRFLGWIGLGYGSVGLNPGALARRTNATLYPRHAYGHSTWFMRGHHFEATMQVIARHENLELTRT
jgi:hypothetical protein